MLVAIAVLIVVTPLEQEPRDTCKEKGGTCDDDQAAQYWIGSNQYHLNDILLTFCVLDNLLGLLAMRFAHYYGEVSQSVSQFV